MSAGVEERIEEGNRRFRKGDAEGAMRSYESALAIDSGNPRAHYNLGVLHQQAGRQDDAIAHYQRAIEADPRFSQALVNWGNALKEKEDLGGAADLYRRALAIDPADPHARANLARVHWAMGFECQRADRPAEAIRHYEASADLAPDVPGLLLNWADAAAALGNLPDAIALYRRSLVIDSQNAQALNNLADALLREGQAREADDLFDRAARLEPGWVEPRYNQAVAMLYEQRFESGWPGYELRFEADPRMARPMPCDLPRVSSLADPGPIAMLKEQGIGDQLLCSTLLPELFARRKDLLVEVDSRLLHAYRRSFPEGEFVSGPDVAKAISKAARQLPIGSLPGLLRRSAASFASQPKALLRPDPLRVRQMRSRMPSAPCIGVSWRSFRKGLADRKSMPLECLAAFEGADVRLVDLQYGDVGAERAAFDARHPGLRVEVPGLDVFNDLEGLLAVIDLCDLVVTTSNLTAHLAGAIGKRTWLVYPGGKAPFHYWVPGADGRSLWYPAVEITTHRSWSTWHDAMTAIARLWRSSVGR